MKKNSEVSKPSRTNVGVVIGRFHVDDLHEGHLDLLKTIADNYSRMFVVIGLSPCKCTIKNPLDFDTRRRMIMDHFPNAVILYLNDCMEDELWSMELDKTIESRLREGEEPILCGGRESFIKHYSGKYSTYELIPRSYVSGTEIRKQIAIRSRGTVDFRAGAIWAVSNQWPCAIPTVDIAIINDKAPEVEILLGKRNNEFKYRLIGGFVQPGDSFEMSAVRELKEESGLVVSEDKLLYKKSFFIDDWRYKSEVNKITTSLFIVNFCDCSGTPEPKDDIDVLAWFPLNMRLLDKVVPNHIQMIKFLVETIC